MPKIGRVVFTPSLRKPDQCWCRQVVADAARRSNNLLPALLLPCTEEPCGFIERHKHICVKPETSYNGCKETTEWWKDLMWALDKTEKVLPELVMELPRWNGAPDDVCVVPEVFKPTYCLSEITPNVFSNLARLELSLNRYADHFTTLLAGAKSLKTLHIGIATGMWEELSEGFVRSDFSRVFFGCTFPELQSFSTDRITAAQEEIIEFVRGSPALRRLVLRRCRLRGHWVPLVQRLRDDTKLQSLELNYVLGSFDVDGRIGELDGNENYMGPKLEEFFYSEKNTPISEEMIQKHIDFRNYMWDQLARQEPEWFPDTDSDDES